jgi:hypothetical protein
MPNLPLYADEGVDGVVVRGLRRLGWDVVRAIDLHPAGTSDEVHFRSAAEMGRVLVSNDQDMLVIAARWHRNGTVFSGLIFWVPNKYQRVGDVLRAFAAAAVEAEANPLRGRVKFL